MAVFFFCFFIVKPENVELATSAMKNKACEGDVVNFTCSAKASPGVNLYRLFENNTAISDTNAVGIWNRTYSRGGVFLYQCVANNSLGSMSSTSVMLAVNGNIFDFCHSKFWPLCILLY